MTSPYFRGKSAPKEIAEILSSAGNITVIGSPGRLTGMQPAQVEILWPPAQTNQTIQITPNDSSLVLRITYAGWRILLTGDITSTAQGLLLANHADLGADVLVWPHHGGVVNTTGAFFQAVNPDIILVSCAQDRAERIRGMTSTDLLAGRRLYTTAENGALSVFVNRAGIEVRPFIPK